MYAPSDLLEQVKKQIKAEFNGLITHIQWWHEDEYTTIVVELNDITWHLRVEDYARQLINEIIGDGYIVSPHVTPIESVGEPDELFHLTYYASSNIFFLDYYAPERPKSNPFKTSIYYARMIEGMHRVHLDPPSELWSRLFRPIKEVLAKRRGVHSFCKELAPDLRDFLVEHLDFIERMIEASGERLEVLPAPMTVLPPSPLANGRKPSLARQQEMALPTAVAA